MSRIERLSAVTDTYTLTGVPSTSPKIPFGAAAGGVFVVNSTTGSGVTTVSWYVAFTADGTPAQLNDGSSDITTSITVGKAYPLPDAAFGCQYLVGVVNGTSTPTATIRLCVKT